MKWPAVQIEQYKNVRKNMFSTKSEIQSAFLGAFCPPNGGGGGLCGHIDCDSLKRALETEITNAVEQNFFARSQWPVRFS